MGWIFCEIFVLFQVNASSAKTKVHEITLKVDEVLREYNFSTYYEDPSYHMSIVWMLGNIEEQESETRKHQLIETFAHTLNELTLQDEFIMQFKVDHVILKCGHKVYRIKLKGETY